MDCLSCEVTEERNGIFEATLTYPVTGHHADAIVVGAIFKAVAHRGDVGQLFEIYEISADFEGNIEAQARHISYRLGYIPCSPFSAHNVIDAFSYLPSHMIETGGFTFQTTKQTNADFQIDIPRSTRAVLGGEEGSFLDVYGGEYEFDNFTVKLHGNRGSDKGVVLRYGKNITDISQEQEISETYTGLYPYYNSDDTYIELPEKVVYCSNAANFAYHRVLILDCSNEFKDEYDDPKVPTEAEMRTFAQKYMNDHDFGVPKVSLSVSFDAQGVTDMEYVLLCDMVTVIFPELRVSAKSKVIKTVYDTILGKYKEIELGSPKASFASTLASQISGSAEKSSLELLDTRNHLEKAQDELTAKLLGANGGYKVEVTNADGQIIETLYLDNLDPALANHVWRWNINGLGYSSNGINGPYTIGITKDGEIVADFIKTGTLDASLINVANLYASAINMNSSMTLDGKISDIDGDISDLNEDVTNVNTTLANHQTQITANTNGLSTKVSATDYNGNNIVSKINQSATTVTIAANRINLNGATLVNGTLSSQASVDFVGLCKMLISGATLKTSRIINNTDYNMLSIDYTTGNTSISTSDSRVVQYQYANIKKGTATHGIKIGNFMSTDGTNLSVLGGNTYQNFVQGSFEVAPISGNSNFKCSGTKSRVASTSSYGRRLLYCYETPTPMFGDVGSGIIDNDGYAYVEIGDIFEETIRTDNQYYVFLQKEGAGDLYVSEKQLNYFVVVGTPGLRFSWEIKAVQREYEFLRLDEDVLYNPDIEDIELMYNDELEKIMSKQEEVLYETA